MNGSLVAKRVGLWGLPVCALSAVLGWSQPARGLNIVLDFDADQSADPGFDSDHSGLISLFQYAEQFYQDRIVTGHTLTIHYWYANLSDPNSTLGQHTLVSQSGGRETEANIRIDTTFNGVERNWFIDPTPASDTEFTMQQTLWRDLTISQRTDLYTFGAGIPDTFEVGYTGSATAGGGANGAIDMLSVILHEVGHALGMASDNDTTQTQTDDGDYDFNSAFVFGKTLAVETANTSGDDNLNIAHLESNFALMNPSVSGSTRVLPSHTDLFAMGSGGLFTSLDVPRREFYGGNNWNTAGNWSGNRVPEADDDVFIRDAQGSGVDIFAGLSANGVARHVTVSEGATLDTNDFKLTAAGLVTVTGTGSNIFISDIGGTPANGELEANQVFLQDGGQILMLGGTLDTINLFIDAGTTLGNSFDQASVQIDNVLVNNGTISSNLNSLMVFTSSDPNPWDLDGGGSTGTLNAQSGDMHFDTGGLSDSFQGTMNIGNGLALHFIRIDAPWTLQSGTVNMTGHATDATKRARLMGGGLTFIAGQINVNGIGHIDAPLVMTGGLIRLLTNDTVEFNSSVNFSGGTITAGQGSNVNFDSAVTLSGSAFFRSHSDSAADGDIEFNSTTTYDGGNIVFDGATTAGGIVRHDGNVVVSDDTTVTAGTFDMDGGDGSANTWTINKELIVNADRVETQSILLGNVVNSTFNINNPGTLVVVGSSSGGSLTINLPGSAAWSLAGTANLDGSVPVSLPLFTLIPTMIAGSPVNASGTINVQDRVAISARLGLSGTINILDAGSQLRLIGGSLVDPNSLAGGTITGLGTLVSTADHALVGRGTINTAIDFNDNASLRADNGTLVINGEIQDVGTIGTADTDGILHVTHAWNTNVANQVELQGGSLIGDPGENVINGTVLNPGLIIGFGTVAVHQVVNDGRIAAKGGTLVLDYFQNPDLDGGGNDGIIEAIQGDLHIVDPVTDLFDGVATVGAKRTMTFSGGWTLQSGTLNLNGGNSSVDAAKVNGLSQTLRGTVNVDQIATFDLPTSFASSVQVHLNDFTDNLRLDQDAKIEAGATFTGGGKLSNVIGSTLTLLDGANVGVRLDNNGLLEIGSSPGSATVAQFTQVLGTLHIEIGGTTPGLEHDQLNVIDTVQLPGGLAILDVDLIGGFNPDYGDLFTVLTADVINGDFGQVIINGQTPGKFQLGATNVALVPSLELDPSGLDMLSFITTAPGDLNLDGTVNIGDFLTFQNNFNDAGDWFDGDFNGDGQVNIGDFLLLQNNFNDVFFVPAGGAPAPGAGLGTADGLALLADFAAASGVGVTQTPEPATATLLALGAALLARRRGRRAS